MKKSWALRCFGMLTAIAFGLLIFWYIQKNSPEKADANTPNVVIISVDTLRADHLGAYGYKKDTTPNIDAFARDNLLYQNAFTPASCTVPSYASLFTGLYPLNHQTFDGKLSSKAPTLAEKLKKDGYNTAGFVSSTILNNNFNNLGRGFKKYEEATEADVKADPDGAYILDLPENDPKIPNVVIRAQRTTDQANDWLEKNSSEKFFMFVHYFDPHMPYGSPEPFTDKYASALPENSLKDGERQNIAVNQEMTARDLEYLEAKYDEDIAYTDFYIGRLLEKIKTLNLNNNTLIIITADHGESFENSYQGHCYRVYDSIIRIPLLIHDPRQTEPKRINTQASLIDLYPTIVNRVGIKNNTNVDGIDILKYIVDDTETRDPLYSMSMPLPSYFVQSTAKKFKFAGQLFAAINNSTRLIYNENSGQKDFYDIAQNPGQTIPKKYSNEAVTLYEEMALWLTNNRNAEKNKLFDESNKIYEQMKSLGYL